MNIAKSAVVVSKKSLASLKLGLRSFSTNSRKMLVGEYIFNAAAEVYERLISQDSKFFLRNYKVLN